ncbi:hypothetical protein D3C75_1078200 [compost metagenome]
MGGNPVEMGIPLNPEAFRLLLGPGLYAGYLKTSEGHIAGAHRNMERSHTPVGRNVRKIKNRLFISVCLIGDAAFVHPVHIIIIAVSRRYGKLLVQPTAEIDHIPLGSK